MSEFLPIRVAAYIDTVRWTRGETMPETIQTTLPEVAAFRALNALYDAMYHVHGQEELDWLLAAPRPILDAYAKAGRAVKMLDKQPPAETPPA